MTRIHPLIICGGNGTRLWPLSRTQSPKQFQRVAGDGSLTFFQTAVQRHRGALYHDPVVVTGARHRGTVTQQLRQVQAQARVLCEPEGRNTGPAVLAAATVLHAEDPDAVLLVIPADHVIEGRLGATVEACLPAVRDGRIVTFGIPPRYPETGFGYIVDAGPLEDRPGLHRVAGFVEKPAFEDAQAMIERGTAYWASGLSMFSAATILEEYRRFDPQTAQAVDEAVRDGTSAHGALHLAAEAFSRAGSMATEQAVFERSDRIALAPLNVRWDDVGSWRAMYRISDADGDGNVLQGDVIARDARNTMVRANGRLVSVVGVSDVVVIDTPDALLVARMDATQAVKSVVEDLRGSGRPEAEEHADAMPALVPMQKSPALEELMQTDRFHLGTAEIDVGRSMELPRGHTSSQVIVVSGTVQAVGPRWRKTVVEGGRIYADPRGPVSLVNTGDEPAELLFLRLEQPDPPGTAQDGAVHG